MCCPFVCASRHAIERTKCIEKDEEKKLDFFPLNHIGIIHSSIKYDKWTAKDSPKLSVCSIKHIE